MNSVHTNDHEAINSRRDVTVNFATINSDCQLFCDKDLLIRIIIYVCGESDIGTVAFINTMEVKSEEIVIS